MSYQHAPFFNCGKLGLYEKINLGVFAGWWDFGHCVARKRFDRITIGQCRQVSRTVHNRTVGLVNNQPD